MKYLRYNILVCTILFLLPTGLIAQDSNSEEMEQAIEDTVAQTDGVDFQRVGPRVVQGAFRQIPRENLMGGISVVDVPRIMEKNYMTFSLENMQAFAGGFNGSLWGMGDYLVLVDGIPRDPGSINPSAIQQISFMKGVSANVLYGSRAANGVVYITTKRGGDHDLQINGRVNGGINIPIRYPEYLGSAEYMTLYNEALQNDGLPQQYTAETIYRHSRGNDPYRYPNVDYYSPDYLRDFTNRYQGNVELSGGTETANYYTNINFITSNSLLDFGEGENLRGNNFNIRSNVDFELNENIRASVGAGVIYDEQNGVNTDYWGQASTLRPDRYTPLIPIDMFVDGNQNLQQIIENSDHVINDRYLLGGNQIYSSNPIADIYAGGTNQSVGRQFQFNTAITMDLDAVLEGLEFNSMFGVDYLSSYYQGFNNQYAVYDPNWVAFDGENQVSSLNTFGQDARTGVQNVDNSIFQQTLAFSGQFNYHRNIDQDNQISAMLITNVHQLSYSGEYHRTGNLNLGLQLGYNHREKYYVDFSAAIPHSAKLPEGNRQAFSPTATLGWRVSEEGFMANASAINNLKLFVSGGIVNTDMPIPGYHLYEARYSQADGAFFGWGDGNLRQGTQSFRGANPNLTYIKRKELNAGIDASFFDNTLNIESTVFYNRNEGGVIQASALYPSYFSTGWPENSFIPYVNYNIDQRKGIDFNLRFNEELGGVNWSLGLAGTFFDSKAVRRAEINQFDYQNTEGTPLDGIWGLQSQGLFMDQQEIDNHEASQQFGTVRPGDIKYVDQNNDNVINSQDQVYLGRAGWNGAPMEFGVHLTARWNNFTLFTLGTGQFGSYGVMSGDYYWVNGDNKYSSVVRDRWTEETANTATYPRLTTQTGSNNFRTSDFWMYSTDRFDLQKVQLTYDLPASFLQASNIRQLQVYVTGANLLTISPNRDIMETNVGTTPQMRFFNLGINAKF
ncbi:SusC/RagA family TonB-linked outer membrane protein [Rhodohalobacter sp. SW132]|uniref:SusC/RagA family TonB-linked outer membrane protein n=1 Tax=Rhodohalobacter sp. SW132 TaxID=2293433 RepID=UPI000E2591A0|nr:SusC/RagA family TonB-linked outer membrane protein [Rhodohalobacter sp. SW132]REL24723.1 SusC/RagA family TonB-linked outer membrane protein [Rhodohalobacter sp. SW132]